MHEANVTFPALAHHRRCQRLGIERGALLLAACRQLRGNIVAADGRAYSGETRHAYPAPDAAAASAARRRINDFTKKKGHRKCDRELISASRRALELQELGVI